MQTVIDNPSLFKLFGGKFEFIDSGFATGSYNMEFDTRRTQLVQSGESLPMFRVYGWDPWAVSLGANQNEAEIDSDKCSSLGFDLVRRPTGGRAVLHANEITYSCVLQLHDKLSVHDAYREIHELLVDSFLLMGCKDLDFEKSQPDFKDFYNRSEMAVSCFASSARYEITYKGRKIVGSAQRLFGRTLLQHGSILLDEGHEQIAWVTKSRNPEGPSRLADYIRAHSSTLSESAGRKILYSEAAEAVYKNSLPK